MAKQDKVTKEVFFDDQEVEENPSIEDEQDQDQEEDDSEEDQDDFEEESEGDEESSESDDEEPEDEDDDEVLVSFGDEEPEKTEEDGTPLIKSFRKREREKDKKIRELNKRLAALEKTEEVQTSLPKKPTLDDFDYDDGKFEAALLDWHEKKKNHDKQEQAKAEEAKAQEEQWKAAQKKYGSRKKELGFSDFEDVEETVASTLSASQQNLIVGGSEDSAKLIYAIGKSPKKLAELAAIKDPVKFIWTVAKLEGQVKVEKQSRKPSAKPEKRVKGGGSASVAKDSALERLRAEAEKTGDYSKVFAYKRNKT